MLQQNDGLGHGTAATSRKQETETLTQTLEELEIIKLAVGFSVRLRNTSIMTLWRSRPLPKQKKRLTTAEAQETQELWPLSEVLPAPSRKEETAVSL
jgi:hypothetical protein